MPDHRTIPLTQGQVAIVDDRDYDLVSQFKWYARYTKSTKSFYAMRNERVGGKRRTIIMSRFILGIADPMVKVDHWNHDTLDYRRENLRECSNAENCRNRRMRSDNTSGYKGVYWAKSQGKWWALVCVNGERHSMGYFDDKEQAKVAYDDGARRLHGEFALTNQDFSAMDEWKAQRAAQGQPQRIQIEATSAAAD